MPTGKPIDQQAKLTILSKIRDGGMSVTDASEAYNVSSKLSTDGYGNML